MGHACWWCCSSQRCQWHQRHSDAHHPTCTGTTSAISRLGQSRRWCPITKHTTQHSEVTTAPQVLLVASFPRSSPVRLMWSSKSFFPWLHLKFFARQNLMSLRKPVGIQREVTYIFKNLIQAHGCIIPSETTLLCHHLVFWDQRNCLWS